MLGEWPWKPTWEQASRVRQSTRCLVVIGYSVPQTDLTSQALIRSSLSGGRLRLLVVANPDQEARARVIDLARGAITAQTRIFELETLSDFARLLDETPAERQEREALASRVQRLQRRIRTVESLTEPLELHDLDLFEGRIADLEALEARVSDLEEQR